MINTVLSAAGLLFMSTHISFADALSYQYKSFLKLEHDNNKIMQVSDTESTNGATVNNSLELFKTSARSESYLKGVLLVSEYTGENKKVHSDEDYSVFYGSNYTWPRLAVALQGEHRRESTYINEIEDAGIKENSKFRITNNLGAGLTYIISSRSTITLDASINDLAFPDFVPVSLSEYTYINKSISGAYRLTKKSQLILSLYETNYDAHSNDTSTDTTGFNMTLVHSFNPIWSGSVSYGERDSDSSPACSLDDCNNEGKLYNFSLERKGVKSELNFSFRKSLTPNSTGYLNETEQVVASYKLRLTPRLSAEFQYRDYENKSIDRSGSARNKSNESSALNFHYALDEQWYLTSRLTHKEQEFPSSINSRQADSNSLYIILGFNGKKTNFTL